MNIFKFFQKHQITQEDIDAEIIKLKAEQKYKRMYVTPPPLLMWSKPIVDKKGYIKAIGKLQTNQKEIDRWEKEHYDWLPEKS